VSAVAGHCLICPHYFVLCTCVCVCVCVCASRRCQKFCRPDTPKPSRKMALLVSLTPQTGPYRGLSRRPAPRARHLPHRPATLALPPRMSPRIKVYPPLLLRTKRWFLVPLAQVALIWFKIHSKGGVMHRKTRSVCEFGIVLL
jgi:hypothetical protein